MNCHRTKISLIVSLAVATAFVIGFFTRYLFFPRTRDVTDGTIASNSDSTEKFDAQEYFLENVNPENIRDNLRLVLYEALLKTLRFTLYELKTVFIEILSPGA